MKHATNPNATVWEIVNVLERSVFALDANKMAVYVWLTETSKMIHFVTYDEYLRSEAFTIACFENVNSRCQLVMIEADTIDKSEHGKS